MTTLARTCRACGQPFEIGELEQAELREIAERRGWKLLFPGRCEPCRSNAQRARLVTEVRESFPITCGDCGATFLFREQDQRYYLARGFQQPSRCPPCRPRRQNMEANG